MRKNSLLILLIFVILPFIFYGNNSLGLFESSEARYAEVAREMLQTGDYLSPQIDYIYHFTKPPLTYWITALGMKIFGINSFGARFFVSFLAILVIILTFKIGNELQLEGLFSAIILSSFPLFFFMGKILTTDMFLTFFITLGFYLFLLYSNDKISRKFFSISFAIVLALSVLTKGQVPLLYFVLIIIPYAYFKEKMRYLKVLGSPLFLLTFFTLSLPWFILVGIKHSGLLKYLLLKEGIEAAYSSKRFHPGPIYYYVPVLFVGLSPLVMLFPSIKSIKEMKHLIGYTLLPFLIFSIFPSKLPTYLLPSVPGWALIFSKRVEKRRLFFSQIYFLLILSIFFGTIILNKEFLVQKLLLFKTFLLLLFSLCSLGFSFHFSKRDLTKALLTFIASIFFLFSIIVTVIHYNPEKFKIARDTAYFIKQNLNEEDKVLELRTTIFSIPFYLERKIYVFENNFFRKKFISKKSDHIIENEESLKEFLTNNDYVWVLVDKNSEIYLKKNFPQYSCLKRGERYIVYGSEKLSQRIQNQSK